MATNRYGGLKYVICSWVIGEAEWLVLSLKYSLKYPSHSREQLKKEIQDLAVGLKSDDCFVMEQIQLHEILDCTLPASSIYLGKSGEKKKPLNRCLAASVQRGKS